MRLEDGAQPLIFCYLLDQSLLTWATPCRRPRKPFVPALDRDRG